MFNRSMTRSALMGAAGVLALIGHARADGTSHEVSIAGGELTVALDELAHQTATELVYSSEALKGLRTAGVSGHFTPEQAAAKLLSGTSLAVRRDVSGAMAVAPKKVAADSASLHESGTQKSVRLAQVDQRGASADDAAAESASASGARDLEEIVVTAERRAGSVLSTSIAMTAFSGEMLQQEQIKGVQALQQITPSLSVGTAGGYQLVNIRGVGTQSTITSGSAGVVVIRDGVPNSSPGQGLGVPFYDIADVQVLRGPQGTFVGANSTAGAIQINSQKPNFDGLNGYVAAQAATYSNTKIDGAVNLPISETFAARLAFNVEQRDSFYHDIGAQNSGPYLGGAPAPYEGGSSSTQIDPGNLNVRDLRARLLWKPDDSTFQALLTAELHTNKTDGLPAQPIINTFSPLPGLSCPRAADGNGPCHGLYYAGYSGSPYLINSWYQAQKWDQEINAFGLELDYTLPNQIALRSMSSAQYVHTISNNNVSGDSINVGYQQQNMSDVYYNQEFDVLSSSAGPVTWIAGVNGFYHLARNTNYNVNAAPPYSVAAPAIQVTPDFGVLYRQVAVFGQVSWQFAPTLQLQIGARQNWDNNPNYGSIVTYRPNGLSTLVASNTAVNYPKESTPTGKVGLNWTPLAGQYFYAFAARGYKPGTTNAGTTPSKKETMMDYELGWKGRLLDDRMLMQVGAYYMTYRNMQQTLFKYNTTSPPGNAVGNVPSATIKGLEASMQSRWGRAGFDANVAYNDSQLGAFSAVASYKFPAGYGSTRQCNSGETPLPGNSNCTNYTPYVQQFDGMSLPYAPKWTASATVRYDVPVLGNTLQPRVTYSYTGEQYASIFQSDDFFLMGSRGLWNAYLEYSAGPWTTTAYVTNLADKTYVSGYWLSGNVLATTMYFGDRRQVGLQLNRTF